MGEERVAGKKRLVCHCLPEDLITVQPSGGFVATILLVTCEDGLTQAIGQGLGAQGHQTVVAQNGSEALRAIWNVRFALVILDVLLPESDGMEILQWVRADPNLKSVPLLFLAPSGWASQPWQEPIGSNEVLVKPLDVARLIEKTEALLAREGGSDRAKEPERLHVGPILLDSRTFSVYAGAVAVPLTPTEFKLLRYFIEHVGEVVPVPSLTRYLWGSEGQLGSSELIRVHIRNLRIKIQRSVGCPFQSISTVPRKGYIMPREL